MFELHLTDKKDIYGQVKALVAPHICGSFDILRTPNGKPYIKGNPVYFSVSHSGEKAVIAICDKPVGVDIELLENVGINKFSRIISRYSEKERAEISNNPELFLKNWTMKEAFIKMRGGTLASDLKHLEYFGGNIFFHNNLCDCIHEHMSVSDGIVCSVCIERN